jgi:serine-type D-Ala-D-Ala carboxypeptidase/endopeptidase
MRSVTRRHVVTAALALAGCGPLALAPRSAESSAEDAVLSDDEIRKLLHMRIAARQSRGLVVGVIERGRRRIVSAGVMGKSDSGALDGNTLFGIASLTKPFVALLLADAVRRGELNYQSPAANFLPADVRLPERNGRKITVLDLATHTSGLPHELPNAEQVARSARNAAEGRAALYAYLASCKLLSEPGQSWSYSNLDYALITHMLEHRTGKSYATLLGERITAPLGMSSTVTTLTEAMRSPRASPHLASLEPSPEWNKPWSGAVLQSTASDLLTFIAANLPDARTALTSTISEMLTIRRPAPAIGAEQAVGWYVYPFGRRPMAGHSGGVVASRPARCSTRQSALVSCFSPIPRSFRRILPDTYCAPACLSTGRRAPWCSMPWRWRDTSATIAIAVERSRASSAVIQDSCS